MTFTILVINPGSTSTKIGLYEDDKEIFTKNISHPIEELNNFKNIAEQYEFRKKFVINELTTHNIDISKINAIVGRGGLLKPILGGTYEVTEQMLQDLKNAKYGEHASNLGALIAFAIANTIPNCKAFIVDPVVVDEMHQIARISGSPLIERKSIFHALNQKSVARHAAQQLNKKYEDINLIVAHLGGGISVGIHCKGKVIDVNNALDGDGPFSPERSGGLPAGQLAQLCFSAKYTYAQIKKHITGNGGVVAYLGTNDCKAIEERVKSQDQNAIIIHDAMAYQISKEIGALATVVNGQVDAIVLTGGLAYDKLLIEKITKRTSFIAKIMVFPGEKELEALKEGALRVLKKQEESKIY